MIYLIKYLIINFDKINLNNLFLKNWKINFKMSEKNNIDNKNKTEDFIKKISINKNNDINNIIFKSWHKNY